MEFTGDPLLAGAFGTKDSDTRRYKPLHATYQTFYGMSAVQVPSQVRVFWIKHSLATSRPSGSGKSISECVRKEGTLSEILAT